MSLWRVGIDKNAAACDATQIQLAYLFDGLFTLFHPMEIGRNVSNTTETLPQMHKQKQRGVNSFGLDQAESLGSLNSPLPNTAKVFNINLFKSPTKRFLCGASTCLWIKTENICGMYDIWVTVSSAAAMQIYLWSRHVATIFAASVIISLASHMKLYDSFCWNVVTAGQMDWSNRSEAEPLT